MSSARLARLERAASREPRLCVGVLSGTSVDAAEAALCRIAGTGGGVELTLLAHRSQPFSSELRSRILRAHSPSEICTLNYELGEHFAAAVRSVVEAAGLTCEDVDLVGSHGQTLAHLPAALSAIPSTLQVGEASIIAERTGIPVVCDFRARDMAAGGEGAPLVPYFDWAMFRLAGKRRALHNLGGIGNLSVVSDALEDTLAFDTGPANMLLDGLSARLTGDPAAYDKDGMLSSRGQVRGDLLSEVLRLPFFDAAPPKSAGRETFGEPLVAWLWSRAGDTPHDLLATAVAITVESTARAYERWVLPTGPLDGIYLSGGGSRHPGIVRGLAERMAPLPVRPLADLGFDEAAKEAACFALLASEAVLGVAANIPRVTGAKRRVILGKIVP